MKKILILFLLSLSVNTYPCTTFFINDGDIKVFGRNYDFQIGAGMLIVNQRNNIKESYSSANKNTAKWISKYGSITFNQFGREFPTGGMNEAGLVVELMWMQGTQYPEPDSRPGVSTLQWIQYQLDNFSSVDEVIASDSIIRISKNGVPLHYLIADKNGNSAAIEFIEGKMIYHRGNNMPFRVLANDFYSDAVDYTLIHSGFGGDKELSSSPSSLDRFTKACKLIKEFDKNKESSAIDYSFNVLNNVSQPGSTQWSIVYDLQNAKIYFRTMDANKIKELNFSELDFNCGPGVKMLDVNFDLNGNVFTSLSNYTTEANYNLIKYSYSNVDFLKGSSEEYLKAISAYPELMHCEQK